MQKEFKNSTIRAICCLMIEKKCYQSTFYLLNLLKRWFGHEENLS